MSVTKSAIIHVIGGANGDDDGDEITAVGGIRVVIGARDADARLGGQ